MCGICGLASFETGRQIREETLRVMCDSIRHRGPDDEGILVEGGVGLGMRRLSIIDLNSGNQPIHNEDRSIWTVFNGEIYNYPTLRKELIDVGHSFYTQTDTEVLVHGYEQWGEAMLDRLNGMFAFAIWDKPHRCIFLARDRAGIKPLYYCYRNGELAFGSELKALMIRPEQPRELDLESLQQYLAMEHIPAPRTILKGVNKLPAGSCMRFNGTPPIVRRYWDADLAASQSSCRASLQSTCKELVEHLRESVRLEMISDVPLGVFLSGGIDSSAVAAMMSELAPGNVKSFSIGFNDPTFDESEYAQTVAQHLGTEHRMMRVEPQSLLELVPRLPEILDEPMADASIIPTFALCRFARQYVKVALAGDGGDELLGGYSTMQAHKLAGYYMRLPSFLRRALIEPAVNRLPVSMRNLSLDFRAKRFVHDAAFPTAERHHRWLGAFRNEDLRQVLSPAVLAEVAGINPFAPVHHYSSRARTNDDLNLVLYLDMKLYMESDILTKVDRAGMANSLEVRVPLLNRVFMDYVAHLPITYKLHNFTTKYIFRQALKDRLPAKIVNRSKHGFGMPISRWLGRELRALAQDLLSQSRLQRDGLFQGDYVNMLLNKHLAGQEDNRKPIWTLLIFMLWYDRWLSCSSRSIETNTLTSVKGLVD